MKAFSSPNEFCLPGHKHTDKINAKKSTHLLPKYLLWGQHKTGSPLLHHQLTTLPPDIPSERTNSKPPAPSPPRKSHLDTNSGMPTPRMSTRHSSQIHTVSNIIKKWRIDSDWRLRRNAAELGVKPECTCRHWLWERKQRGNSTTTRRLHAVSPPLLILYVLAQSTMGKKKKRPHGRNEEIQFNLCKNGVSRMSL